MTMPKARSRAKRCRRDRDGGREEADEDPLGFHPADVDGEEGEEEVNRQ